MPVTESFLPALLRARAELQPNSTAYTFIEQAHDPAGFAENLTWSQVYRRAQVVADELRLCGAPGDRAAILMPQGLDYIVAFLGALQTGFIAVPLSAPQFGIYDERVSSALREYQPVALLTASDAAGVVKKYAQSGSSQPVPFVIEVDLLDFASPRDFGPVADRRLGPAYLQYTSGSTRKPTGVVVSHKNVISNVEQAPIQPAVRRDGPQSMMAMSIRREAEQLVGIELPTTMLWNYPTITTLAAYLAKKLSPQDRTKESDAPSDSTNSVLDDLFDRAEGNSS
jgi:acyl-CoA synthetase (AMP-forming)/AMP-acid ligase II